MVVDPGKIRNCRRNLVNTQFGISLLQWRVVQFYIASQCGALYEKGEDEIVILSKDKGYNAVLDYLIQKSKHKLNIILAVNIEDAFLHLCSEKNKERKKLIEGELAHISMHEFQMRANAKRKMKERVGKAFAGTKYERVEAEIIKTLEELSSADKRKLYRTFMHEFGMKDGREIYRVVKEIA